MAQNRSDDDDKKMASYLFSVSSSDPAHQGIVGEFHCHKFGEKLVIRKGRDGQALVLVPRTKDGKVLICGKHFKEKCCSSPVIVNHPITKAKMATALKRFKRKCVYKRGFSITGDDGFDEAVEETKRKIEKRLETRERIKKEEEKQAKELIINANNDSRPLTRAMAKRAKDVVIQQAKKIISRAPQTARVAQAVEVPGDIHTQPSTRIVFNGPYDNKKTTNLKIINTSARRIGWAIKVTNTNRLEVHPASGVLDPKEITLLTISCDKIAFGQDFLQLDGGDIYPLEDLSNDRMMIEWTNTPAGAAKKFRREWFEADGMTRRKNLPIEYNP